MFYNYEIANKLLYNSRNKDVIVAADNIVNKNEFLLPPFGRVVINVNSNFQSNQTSRSYWRLVHGFTFLGDLYVSYNRTNDIKYLLKGKELIELWFKYRTNNPSDEMIYHDETTALRLSYLLKFFYISHDVIDQNFNITVKNEIEETVEILLQDSFHSTNTNHGMFQDMALLAYVILKEENPKSSNIYKVAIKRLLNYFLTCFTSDGVHKEHSPDYHYMVTNNVKKISDIIKSLDNNLDEQEKKLINIFENAESYSMYVLLPNLRLPKISDCSGIELQNNQTYFNMFNSPEFNFVKTGGEQGSAPNEKQKAFLDAGTFFSRTGWKKNDLYFFFLASYNGAYHKHTDDLSFILYDKREIFIDAGPNGYDYKDRYTKYAYSGYAHSSLIVNNTSLPRNDEKFDHVGIDYAKYEPDGNVFEVKGYNKRYENIVHNRTIRGNNLEKEYHILDEIISSKRNEYRVLFQVSHELNVIINSNMVSIYESNFKIAELEIMNNEDNSDIQVTLIKGQKSPLRGYEFPKMGENIPSNTIEILFYNKNNLSKLETIIRLKDFKLNPIVYENELSFGKKNVKYTFYEPDNTSDKLLVIFSAMMPSYSYKYNYYSTLKDVEAHQLYIKDDAGEYGNYYFGNNKNVDFETEVMSLIMNIIRKHNISFEKVTLIGSSKGGTAALYYGLKYGFQNVISGAPQTQIGNFVLSEAPHSDVGKVVSGGEDEGDRLYLNNKFTNLDIPPGYYKNFYLCVGTKDHHFKGHVNPLKYHLSNMNVTLNIKEIPDATHKDLKYLFKDFIFESLNKIYDTKIDYQLNQIAPINLSSLRTNRADGKLSITLDVDFPEYIVIFHMLDKNKNITSKSRLQKSNIITLKEEAYLNKRIKIFIRGKNETKIIISDIIRDLDNIIFNNVK